MNYKQILRQAIDLHVHIGPEIIPRKFTLDELVNYERGKLKGMGVKNHFFPTVAMANRSLSNDKPFVIYSVVLNRYLGGLNSEAILASAALSEKPIIVWFPTLHAKNVSQFDKFEIPLEWIDADIRSKIRLGKTDKIKAISIFDKSRNISRETVKVLQAIKTCQAILATGHLSWVESLNLVRFASQKIGIKKIIITHPIYQKINIPLKVQVELVKLGAVIEHSYSMYSIDKIPIKKIARQIKKIGAENCILSSDVGQTFSESPSEALQDFLFLLEQEGVTEEQIRIMLIKNPLRLVE